MKSNKLLNMICLFAVAASGLSTATAAKTKASNEPSLSGAGRKLESQYADQLKSLQAEIVKALPTLDERQRDACEKSREAVKKAEATATTAQQALGKVQSAKALVDHAKGKWIGGAEKAIAQAETALKKATTDAEREAAKKDMAASQAGKEDGVKALKERQAAVDKAMIDEPKLTKENQVAQAALTQAKSEESAATNALLAKAESFLASDKLDAKLAMCAVLAGATPRGLAEYAMQGKEQEALVDLLLADAKLMNEMLVAGGAKFGKYGQAMQIYSEIQKASPRSKDGLFQRLALATSLEHAVPISQSNPDSQTDGAATVDPVKRYLHYEKAYLDGELDPAFKNLTTWEYRMVVNCDASDEILAWGRAMLRNYRPDHISNPQYGWRYSASVKTDVPYGSQNVKDDLPTLQQYQNIIKNGGICGRRAFFGRFILRSFGIPTWGVTQRAHAALSHWTPAGWVVNLGAGFQHSWWDKDEVPRSGSDFLLETQAREHAVDYLKVLRAQWVSRTLGEEEYNDRKKVAGGFWSSMGHFQTVVLASKAVELGPLGEELGEANESPEEMAKAVGKVTTTDEDKKVVIARNGVITIPAAVCDGATLLKSTQGGQQLFSGGGTISFEVKAPRAGNYELRARVATVQESPKMQLVTNDAKEPLEFTVPYTIGMWEQTPPVVVSLTGGRNTFRFARPAGSRGLSIKEFTLVPEGVVVEKAEAAATPAESGGRMARALPANQQALFNELLMGTLADLSDANELRPLPMNISKARSKVWLAKVGSGSKLTFQAMDGDKQASFGFGDLTAADHALLARLVAALRPDNIKAQCAAGIFMELVGQTDVADAYYQKAGPDFQKKLEDLFK